MMSCWVLCVACSCVLWTIVQSAVLHLPREYQPYNCTPEVHRRHPTVAWKYEVLLGNGAWIEMQCPFEWLMFNETACQCEYSNTTHIGTCQDENIPHPQSRTKFLKWDPPNNRMVEIDCQATIPFPLRSQEYLIFNHTSCKCEWNPVMEANKSLVYTTQDNRTSCYSVTNVTFDTPEAKNHEGSSFLKWSDVDIATWPHLQELVVGPGYTAARLGQNYYYRDSILTGNSGNDWTFKLTFQINSSLQMKRIILLTDGCILKKIVRKQTFYTPVASTFRIAYQIGQVISRTPATFEVMANGITTSCSDPTNTGIHSMKHFELRFYHGEIGIRVDGLKCIQPLLPAAMAEMLVFNDQCDILLGFNPNQGDKFIGLLDTYQVIRECIRLEPTQV